MVLVILPVLAQAGGKGNGGQKPAKETRDSPPAPIGLERERYFFRSGHDGDCLGEDDRLEWSAAGALAPGESFSFTPARPGCEDHAAAITVTATWSAGELELTSTVPDADYASWDPEQAGRPIRAPVTAGRAQLCMFPEFSGGGVSYTITLTNRSAEVVESIQLTGRHENDWPLYFYPRCLNADADGDGWNDSLEHTMSILLYPIGYLDGVLQPDVLWGSNYLRAVPGSLHPNDEIDSFPPDLDDDGLVTLDDVAFIERWLGEGNGIPLSRISPNAGVEWFHNNTLPFRRYDLDGDGWVDEHDLRIVEASIGTVPFDDADPVAPTARVLSPAPGDIVARGEAIRITSHAWDNAALARVEYFVNGKLACSSDEPVPSFGFESPLFSCWWEVPRRSSDHVIEIRVIDAAGNVGWSSAVTVKGR